LRPAQEKFAESHLQNNHRKITRGMPQAVEHLLCKCKGLTSNFSPRKRERVKERGRERKRESEGGRREEGRKERRKERRKKGRKEGRKEGKSQSYRECLTKHNFMIS
jgi:hypothetical protein